MYKRRTAYCTSHLWIDTTNKAFPAKYASLKAAVVAAIAAKYAVEVIPCFDKHTKTKCFKKMKRS